MFKRTETSAKEAAPAVLKGHIDKFEAGQVLGWAFNPALPESALTVQLFEGQDLLGEGTADLFREDLKQAGFGSGKHGFAIHLLKPMDDGAPHEIRLIERSAQALIESKTFELRISDRWHGRIGSVDGAVVSGKFGCDEASSGTVEFAIYVDAIRIGEGVAEWRAEEKVFRFSYALPGEYFDGMPHVVSVSLIKQKGGDASYAAILPPILTPWQYLVTGTEGGHHLYRGLPPGVVRRLSAFEARASSLIKARRPEALGNLVTAYDVLNEGYEARKDFPVLALEEVSEPDISIIIPVHNKFELTYNCVASIILSDNVSTCEVIIIDDCSTDYTTRLTDYIENVHVIVNEENLGFLRNCNKAAKAAKGKYLVLLNNDTEVGSRWLDEMVGVFNRFSKVGAVGAKLTFPDGRLQEAGGIVWDNGQPWNLGRDGNPTDPQWNYVRQADYLSGAALMVPKVLWDELGGLSDEFAPAYYEDTDLAFKVRAAGYRTVYCPHAEVVHFEGMSHGRDTGSGLKKYQRVNAPKFCAKWTDAFAHNGRVGTDLWKHKDRGVRYRAIVIDYATPEPDKNAGAYAAVQEMRLLQAHGFKITFLPENLAHFGKYTIDLQKMGIECIHAPFFGSVAHFLKERGHEFDLAFVTRYEVAERHIDQIRQHSKAKVLFNNADLHFLRELRAALAKENPDLSGPLATRDRELGLMRKVDALVSYNEAEHAVIASHNFQDQNIFKCPWVLPLRGHKVPFEKREGLAFLGGYRHHPNVEAVEFFVEKVMPLLRSSGRDIKFHIFGSHPPESFVKLAARDVILEGYVESLDDVFERSRIFVAPLLSGAGIKGKVLDAMSYGVPTVLSPVAVEATGLSHGLSTYVAASPEEWVSAILTLYDDPVKWKKLSENSLALVEANYSFENGWKDMGKAVGYLGLYGGRAESYMVAGLDRHDKERRAPMTPYRADAEPGRAVAERAG